MSDGLQKKSAAMFTACGLKSAKSLLSAGLFEGHLPFDSEEKLRFSAKKPGRRITVC